MFRDESCLLSGEQSHLGGIEDVFNLVLPFWVGLETPFERMFPTTEACFLKDT